jgi:hypothetical protein
VAKSWGIVYEEKQNIEGVKGKKEATLARC